ncbi:MAG: UDP-N-acetylmuramoyl-L-alanyl-D-glutamate--2,6-diaminopimelate ligase [Microthrixaceae bacterium]
MGSRSAIQGPPDDPATTGVVASFVGAQLHGPDDVPLTGATHDSRRVQAGDLFCCVVGANHDGHDFAAVAVDSGATALLVERELDLDVPQLQVDDVRIAMAPASSVVWGDPSSALTVIGVTGTNGKTTVVSMLAAILAEAGKSVEVIGTLTGVRTTPEAPELMAQLAAMRVRGVTHVAMEVSSHALDLARVDSVHFAAAVFTNLGRDHLDHHGSIEAYFRAKAKLFEATRCDLAVVNTDDPRGRLLRDSSEVAVVGYSLDDATALELDQQPVRFEWRGQSVSLPMAGAHNVLNALAAGETAVALGIDAQVVAAALGGLAQVPGRFETVVAHGGGTPDSPTVVVDFAHTPDALEAALSAARYMTGEGGRTWVVFGCGGDRDRSKRPRMGAVADAGADVVVITSDNPRSEDPLRIIEEIRAGCDDDPIIELDRRSAIHEAVTGATSGDVVLIAGKGHEQGQVFAGRTEPFDDRSVAAEMLSGADPTDGPLECGDTK